MSIETLVDKFGRQVSYVRMSVTDRCDFRCVYCMDEEMTFVPRSEVLTIEEMHQIARAFTELGVSKIRLTGGEPLVRNNFLGLCQGLGKLPGIDELVITTNGSRLSKFAVPLKQAGIKRVNISLDSLRPDRFKELTRTGRLQDVLDGIEHARQAGFQRIKINAVILKGRNDDEVNDLVEFVVERNMDISFIEEMPLGAISEHSREESYLSSDELKELLSQRWNLTAINGNNKQAGPSKYYRVDQSDSRVGFISPHSHNFCGDCNRVRVTAEGRLLLCLGNEHSTDLREVVRSAPGDLDVLKAHIVKAMDLKPERHYFDHSNTPEIVRFMSMTGG